MKKYPYNSGRIDIFGDEIWLFTPEAENDPDYSPTYANMEEFYKAHPEKRTKKLAPNMNKATGGEIATATEIRNQIGSKALFMLGAYDIFADKGALGFKIRGSKKWKHIKIRLNGKDLYDVTFTTWRKNRVTHEDELTSETIEDVDVENLHSVIERETGLYTNLAKGGKMENKNEIRYNGKVITKLFPSGYYEFYSDKEERFLKFDDLDDAKAKIDSESVDSRAQGGTITKVAIQSPENNKPLYATLERYTDDKVITNQGTFDKKYVLKEFEAPAHAFKAEGGNINTHPTMEQAYYIFNGYDHYNDKPLYRVESTANSENEYVGEWHTNKSDAQEELDHLNKNKSMEQGGKTEVGNNVSTTASSFNEAQNIIYSLLSIPKDKIRTTGDDNKRLYAGQPKIYSFYAKDNNRFIGSWNANNGKLDVFGIKEDDSLASGGNIGGINSISELRQKNEDAGYFFFSPGTMKAFRTKIESEILGGKYFITSDDNFDRSKREFKIREIKPDGGVINNPFGKKFDTKSEAKEFLKKQISGHKEEDSKVDFWIKMFAPRTEEYRKETLERLKQGVSHFETPEENEAKIEALEYIADNPKEFENYGSEEMASGGKIGKEVRITYFPMEQKYSIWDEKHNMIKEWFNTKSDAERWIKDNGYTLVNNFSGSSLASGGEVGHMETNQDVTLDDWRGYGKIVIPKGTRLTHKTASGIDKKYHFVDDFSWIDKNYPTISRLMKHDAIYYGIDIPQKFVSYKNDVGSLASGGKVSKVFVFDNGGKTIDRYTIILKDGDIYNASENPSSPTGVGTYNHNVTDRLNTTIGYGWQKGRDQASLNRILKSELNDYLNTARGDSDFIGAEVKDLSTLPEGVKEFIVDIQTEEVDRKELGGLLLAGLAGLVVGGAAGYGYRDSISSARKQALDRANKSKERAKAKLEEQKSKIRKVKEDIKRGAISQISRLASGGKVSGDKKKLQEEIKTLEKLIDNSLSDESTKEKAKIKISEKIQKITLLEIEESKEAEIEEEKKLRTQNLKNKRVYVDIDRKFEQKMRNAIHEARIPYKSKNSGDIFRVFLSNQHQLDIVTDLYNSRREKNNLNPVSKEEVSTIIKNRVTKFKSSPVKVKPAIASKVKVEKIRVSKKVAKSRPGVRHKLED